MDLKLIQTYLQNPWIVAALYLVGAVPVALLLDVIFRKVLGRLARRTRTQLDDMMVQYLRRPLAVTVVMLSCWLATDRINPHAPVPALAHGIYATIVVIAWTSAAVRVTKTLLSLLSQSKGDQRVVTPRTLPLFHVGATILVYGLAVYFVLFAWGVDVTAWLASAGIVGVALGFAAKDTLANLLAGIYILADAPYKIGDYLVLGSGYRGRVTDIGIRSTRILTRDDVEIVVPNALIANDIIVNESGGPYEKERISVNVGVAYGSDVDRVRRVILEACHGLDMIAPDPPPQVRFRAFGDSSLNFSLLVWVKKPELRGLLIDALNTRIYRSFARENIEIPFPQRDLHLKSLPPAFTAPPKPREDAS